MDGGRRSVLLAGVSALASNGFSGVATAQATAPLTITSPSSGAFVTSGQSITVTVTVASGTNTNGLAIIGQDPIGSTDLHPVAGSTVAANLQIPANTPPGSYTITAVGSISSGALVMSAPINIVFERADLPTALSVPPGSMTFRFVGDKIPWTVIGTFTGGLLTDVTYSIHLTTTSANPSVATVQNGIVTAVGSGHTNINVTYGSITIRVSITVPNSNRGDLYAPH